MAELVLALRFLLAAILYAFLGITVYVLWRSLQQEAQAPTDTGPVPATLRSVDETDTSAEVPLHLVTAIGRADDNTLTLDDPYSSAYHALILWREGRWWIEDRGSHNGTLLNDDRVTEPTPLRSGDEILIGETRLTFETRKQMLSSADRQKPVSTD